MNEIETTRKKLEENEGYELSDFEEGKLIGFNLGVKLAQKEHNTFQVKLCHDSLFMGFSCLESEDQYGFQTDNNDFRPAWHTWIDKKDAEKLYYFFVNQYLLKQKLGEKTE